MHVFMRVSVNCVRTTCIFISVLCQEQQNRLGRLKLNQTKIRAKCTRCATLTLTGRLSA